eukprot:3131196-Rhodomonas_salina.3
MMMLIRAADSVGGLCEAPPRRERFRPGAVTAGTQTLCCCCSEEKSLLDRTNSIPDLRDLCGTSLMAGWASCVGTARKQAAEPTQSASAAAMKSVAFIVT